MTAAGTGSPRGEGTARRDALAFGLLCETLVLDLLQARGWHCLARRWRCRWGELDLVLSRGQTLLLVEVKGRRRRPDGDLEGLLQQLMPAAKVRRLRLACAAWLSDSANHDHRQWPLLCWLVLMQLRQNCPPVPARSALQQALAASLPDQLGQRLPGAIVPASAAPPGCPAEALWIPLD